MIKSHNDNDNSLFESRQKQHCNVTKFLQCFVALIYTIQHSLLGVASTIGKVTIFAYYWHLNAWKSVIQNIYPKTFSRVSLHMPIFIYSWCFRELHMQSSKICNNTTVSISYVFAGLELFLTSAPLLAAYSDTKTSF